MIDSSGDERDDGYSDALRSIANVFRPMADVYARVAAEINKGDAPHLAKQVAEFGKRVSPQLSELGRRMAQINTSISPQLAELGKQMAAMNAANQAAAANVARFSSMITPQVSGAAQKLADYAAARPRFAPAFGAQLARATSVPRVSIGLLDSIRQTSVVPTVAQQVGHPGAPDEILEILERIAEQHTLPRLRGLTARASRLVFDLWDAARARAREAVARFIGPTAIPKHYQRSYGQRLRISAPLVFDLHAQAEHSIGHLDIRAPGQNGSFRRSCPLPSTENLDDRVEQRLSERRREALCPS